MFDKRTVLVVEDDDTLRSTVEDYLTINNFNVITAADGVEAVDMFFGNQNTVDIVLLDGMLPKLDGFDVLKKIRAVSAVPVIMLSARESEESQLTGFRLGADNYLTKPFLLSVLKEHINSLLSRVAKRNTSVLKAGAVSVFPEDMTVTLNGEKIETTPKEFELLKFFVENKNTVLSRDLILDRIWGIDYYGDFRTVDTIVKQLRKKLTNDYPYIKSIYGIGYLFKV